MIKFMSKSLVSLAIVGALWSPTEAWLGVQRSAGLSCRADFSVCEVAGKVIPLMDRSSVLGQIAAQARRDPARQFGREARAMVMAALDGARTAALRDE